MMIPSISHVANAIGAEELVVELKEFRKLVKEHRKMAKADPRAKDVRNDYQRTKKAAVAMGRALDRVWKRLYWLSFDELDKLSAGRDAMREIADVVDKASARIPSDGRKRARRHAGPNPREICALIIIESWTFVHGKPPGAHNHCVQRICDMYWHVCGGAPIGPENWRRTIGAALTDNGAMRRSIRDQLQRKAVQNEFLNISGTCHAF